MARYETVIGLEVHAHLKTQSKIFCGCSTRFGDAPNANVCPVCSGMPGVLPVLNARVVEFAVKAGLATDCRINPVSVFARKNYFYPDLPKGYQISQYELPIWPSIRRTWTLPGGRPRSSAWASPASTWRRTPARTSTPAHGERELRGLEPRLRAPHRDRVRAGHAQSAAEAVAYLKELRSILVYLGICDGNMEEGSFRCDANVSHPARWVQDGLRHPRTELKNLNSVPARAEGPSNTRSSARSRPAWRTVEAIVQETRLYNAEKNTTASMRGKEEAHDYRYFPDPDLVPLVLSDETVAEAGSAALPELPKARRARFMERLRPVRQRRRRAHGRARPGRLLRGRRAQAYAEPKKIANWIHERASCASCNQSGQRSLRTCRLAPEHGWPELVEAWWTRGVISGKIAKQIFPELCAEGLDPEAPMCGKRGWPRFPTARPWRAAVDAVLAANPAEVAAYRGGKTKLMGFFVGQIMKATKGQANPALVNETVGQKTGVRHRGAAPAVASAPSVPPHQGGRGIPQAFHNG